MTHNFSLLFSIFLPNCSEKTERKKEGKMNWVMYTCNPSTGGGEAKDPFQDHPQLHRKFVANLGNMKPYLKTITIYKRVCKLPKPPFMIFLLIIEN